MITRSAVRKSRKSPPKDVEPEPEKVVARRDRKPKKRKQQLEHKESAIVNIHIHVHSPKTGKPVVAKNQPVVHLYLDDIKKELTKGGGVAPVHRKRRLWSPKVSWSDCSGKSLDEATADGGDLPGSTPARLVTQSDAVVGCNQLYNRSALLRLKNWVNGVSKMEDCEINANDKSANCDEVACMEGSAKDPSTPLSAIHSLDKSHCQSGRHARAVYNGSPHGRTGHLVCQRKRQTHVPVLMKEAVVLLHDIMKKPGLCLRDGQTVVSSTSLLLPSPPPTVAIKKETGCESPDEKYLKTFGGKYLFQDDRSDVSSVYTSNVKTEDEEEEEEDGREVDCDGDGGGGCGGSAGSHKSFYELVYTDTEDTMSGGELCGAQVGESERAVEQEVPSNYALEQETTMEVPGLVENLSGSEKEQEGSEKESIKRSESDGVDVQDSGVQEHSSLSGMDNLNFSEILTKFRTVTESSQGPRIAAVSSLSTTQAKKAGRRNNKPKRSSTSSSSVSPSPECRSSPGGDGGGSGMDTFNPEHDDSSSDSYSSYERPLVVDEDAGGDESSDGGASEPPLGGSQPGEKPPNGAPVESPFEKGPVINCEPSQRVDKDGMKLRNVKDQGDKRAKTMQKRNVPVKVTQSSSSSSSGKPKGTKSKTSGNGPEPRRLTRSQKSYPKPDENFIPLDVAGSTRFAVAKVDKVKPYEKHDATSFRQRMLYGSRVRRFADSATMQSYKLKQKAGKKST